MSAWTDFRDHIESEFARFVTWWEGTTLGQEIDTAAKAAIAELEKIGEVDLKNIAETTATAALAGLSTGGVAGAISAGVRAAIPAFEAAESVVSNSTLGTFVNTIVSQLNTQASTATTDAGTAGEGGAAASS